MDREVDRIARPWGGRTPYGRHRPWPARVDTHLSEGVVPEEVDRWVQAASILHSDGDAMDIAVRNGRIVGVRGRALDRSITAVSAPRTCSAGRPTAPGTG